MHTGAQTQTHTHVQTHIRTHTHTYTNLSAYIYTRSYILTWTSVDYSKTNHTVSSNHLVSNTISIICVLLNSVQF